jgi:tRNA(Ile)-lysidine synthase
VENKIEKIFQSKISSLRDSKFLIALSGGVDSMVLANLFLNNNLSFSVAHCNFNLRDKESDDDEKFIFNWSTENEIKCYISKFNTTDYCQKNKFGIQEGARNLRYEWFNELKDLYSFDYIVTAHHLDDQIETYLINSMRGTGLNGLLGITEKTNSLLRPLLKILKNEILVYANSNKIDFREDTSNSKNNYFRNMIRNLIIPEFKKFDDNVMLKFQTTIDNLNSTKIFADIILNQTKNRIFILKLVK